MPFKSKAEARAAFGGYLGPAMKANAATWEDETPGGIKRLPEHVKDSVKGLGHTRYHLRAARKTSMQHIKKGR